MHKVVDCWFLHMLRVKKSLMYLLTIMLLLLAIELQLYTFQGTIYRDLQYYVCISMLFHNLKVAT